jgi:hypothetical protein
MSEKKVKSGTRYHISSQLKLAVINLYNKLLREKPKARKKYIINEVLIVTNISKSTFYLIKANGCISPKKLNQENQNITLKMKILMKMTQLLINIETLRDSLDRSC